MKSGIFETGSKYPKSDIEHRKCNVRFGGIEISFWSDVDRMLIGFWSELIGLLKWNERNGEDTRTFTQDFEEVGHGRPTGPPCQHVTFYEVMGVPDADGRLLAHLLIAEIHPHHCAHHHHLLLGGRPPRHSITHSITHSLTHWVENQSRISNPIGSVLEVGGADACSSFNPVGKSQVFRGATARCGYLLGAERRGTCACCGGRRSTEGCRPRSLRFIVAPGVTGTGRYRQHGE